MPPAQINALYLGRHAPLSRTAFPRTSLDVTPIALESLEELASGAEPHLLRYRVPESDRLWTTSPARALLGRIALQDSTDDYDVLLSQMPEGHVFAILPDSEREQDHLRDAVGHHISFHPPDRQAFLARFSHNKLPPGARPHCFCTGTFIHTPRGPIPVEDIRVGFPVQTLDYGVQPVRWIGTTLHAEPRAHAPIEIAAGALGRGFPSHTLRVSPHHRLCLRSSIAERMFGQPEILMAARFLLDAPGVRQIDGEIPVRYWHIATARHALVSANGTWAETLFPGLHVPTGMDASDVSQLEVVFDQKLARGKDDAAQAKPPVRPILRGAAQRAFVARHLKQRRAFVMQQLETDDDNSAQAS